MKHRIKSTLYAFILIFTPPLAFATTATPASECPTSWNPDDAPGAIPELRNTGTIVDMGASMKKNYVPNTDCITKEIIDETIPGTQSNWFSKVIQNFVMDRAARVANNGSKTDTMMLIHFFIDKGADTQNAFVKSALAQVKKDHSTSVMVTEVDALINPPAEGLKPKEGEAGGGVQSPKDCAEVDYTGATEDCVYTSTIASSKPYTHLSNILSVGEKAYTNDADMVRGYSTSSKPTRLIFECHAPEGEACESLGLKSNYLTLANSGALPKSYWKFGVYCMAGSSVLVDDDDEIIDSVDGGETFEITENGRNDAHQHSHRCKGISSHPFTIRAVTERKPFQTSNPLSPEDGA